MSLRIQCLDIDSADPQRLARFWAEALGWRITHDTAAEAALEPPEGELGDGLLPDLLFLKVPEEKSGKNRMHFDLRPDDQATEVERLESLGATRADIGQGRRAGSSWPIPRATSSACFRRSRRSTRQRSTG